MYFIKVDKRKFVDAKNKEIYSHGGPIKGWENYYYIWPKFKQKIFGSWRTEQNAENKAVIDMLKKFLPG